MKENELCEHTTCTLCNRPIGHTGLPLFWTVTVEQHRIKPRLAQMGTDTEMTETVLRPVTLTFCEMCASDDTDIAWLGKFSPDYPHPVPPW
jgi:hypothetical protein